jgi:hypothetical protein
VYEPGTVTLPVLVVNDTHERWRGDVRWEVCESTSAVITPDPEGFRIGLAMPDDGIAVAVPHRIGESVAAGTITASAAAGQSTPVGEVVVDLGAGDARTVVFHWGEESNFVHLHCPAAGAQYPPGLQVVG